MSYSAAVTDYFGRLVGAGVLQAPTHEGQAGGLEAGTWVVFQARVSGEEILELGFRAFGCPDTIAAAGSAVEQLNGARVEKALAWSPDRTLEELEIPRQKLGKLLIIQDALRTCFRDWDTGD